MRSHPLRGIALMQLLTAVALGWPVFGQLPDGLAALGMLLITASAIRLIIR